MTEMRKRSIELQSLKTERHGSNTALPVLKFMKAGKEWRIKQGTTICNQN